MKLTVLFLFTAFSVMQAGTVYSQKKKHSFSAKDMSIGNIIEKIEFTTKYRFVYNVKVVDLDYKVDVNAVDVPMSAILALIFKNTGTDFKIIDDQIILTAKTGPVVSPSPTVRRNEDFNVRGKVTDDKGMPLVGAAVSDNGSGNGVQTDFNGEYQIITVGRQTTLSFAYLGYVRQEIKVEGKSIINVVLKEETFKLGELVITTGYQNISAEQVTGSVSKIKAEDFKEQRLSSLDNILEGRIVGYQNGQIRGTTSMKGLTTPLYVIDGFPVEDANLNLDDIESITVLKDAAAASIYGARAANGVVVITTKKAKLGQTNISFSSNLTVTPYRYYTGNLTNSSDIVDLERGWAAGNPYLQATDGSAQGYSNSLLQNAVFTSLGMNTILNGYAGNISMSEMNSRLDGLASKGFKYYDDMAKYAKRDQYFVQHNISVGKATESNTFNASLTYKGNQFEDKNSDSQSLGLNIKNSTDINQWLSLDLGTYIYYNQSDTQSFNPLRPEFKYQPYNQLINDDGTNFSSTAASRYSAYRLQSMQNYGLYNMDITPMDEFGRNLLEGKNFLNRTFAKLNIKFSSALSLNTMFQYEFGADRSSQLRDKDSYSVRSLVNGLVTISPSNTAVYNLPYGDILRQSNIYSNAYTFRQQLNFEKIYNSVHEISAFAGTEIRHNKMEAKENTQYGWDDQSLTFTPVNQAALLKVYGSIFGGYLGQGDFGAARETLNRYVSLYSNAGYTYDRKYSVTGSLRWDRSNLWGTDNKYQNKPTWSAGAGWNVDKESFFKSSIINRLKLRASYGIGGNISKDSAPYLTSYYYGNTNVGGMQGGINSRPNPELSWEKTTTTNVGVDFSLFKERLSGTFDFYNKKGEDLLANTTGVPTEGWGYSTYSINNGGMTNKGFEVTLSGIIIKTPSFSWDATLLYANNKNKVDYVNVEAPAYYLQLDYPRAYPRVGKDFNSIYGYKWAGLSSTGLPQVYDATGTAVTYNPSDLEAIKDYGTMVPIQSGSFHTSVNYKSISLSALFIYELGHKMRNNFLPMLNNVYSSAYGGYLTEIGVVNKNIANRWRQPGDEANTDIPRAVYEYDPEYSSDLQAIYSYADINIIDASNVRLSNISLAYQLPSQLMHKVKLQNVRFNFNVENVFTLAKSKDAKYLLGGYQSPNFVLGVNVNF
ncbi:SusC/RagA family TonB-linked outer membrane protein [Flavobacterium sp. FlaQc-47]|uniref:SusC/RagA family TonB-linked outer membrane protein n=1 Tax=Flavobacterium sp. FlaQc-47 TaxID=3374180 RepID=UPI0037575FED